MIDALVQEPQPLSPAMHTLMDEIGEGKMNSSAALARIGSEIGDAVYGLALQQFNGSTSHTLITWSRSGQEPQRVRKVLMDRLRMGGILEVNCAGDVIVPVSNSVIQFPIRTDDDQRIGSLTAFVEHHTLSVEHCRLLCQLATVFAHRATRPIS